MATGDEEIADLAAGAEGARPAAAQPTAADLGLLKGRERRNRQRKFRLGLPRRARWSCRPIVPETPAEDERRPERALRDKTRRRDDALRGAAG